MRISELIQQIEKDFPVTSAMDFDNSGSNVVNFDSELKGILVTLDITLDAIEYANSENINLIISHHPIIFNKIKNLNDDPVAKRIKLLNKYEISAYSCHTNYDVNIKNGMGTNLVKVLFDDSKISEQSLLDSYKVDDVSFGIGNVITLNDEMNFSDLKDLIVEKLNLDYDKISFYKFKDNVKKIVIIPGSGSSDIDLVIANKPDVVITSELKHNQIIDLKVSNISYLNATHYGLENIFINCFLEYLKSLSILSNIKTMSFDINI